MKPNFPDICLFDDGYWAFRRDCDEDDLESAVEIIECWSDQWKELYFSEDNRSLGNALENADDFLCSALVALHELAWAFPEGRFLSPKLMALRNLLEEINHNDFEPYPEKQNVEAIVLSADNAQWLKDFGYGDCDDAVIAIRVLYS